MWLGFERVVWWVSSKRWIWKGRGGREEGKRRKEASQFYCWFLLCGLASEEEGRSDDKERHGYTSSQ